MPEHAISLSLSELEGLPYLTAVIQEGLRLSNPITHRVRRQFPDNMLSYHGKCIPAGTTVSMTAMLTHLDEDLFPEPRTFRPERWLEAGHRRPENYFAPFGRGTRSCLGETLARAELYLALAYIYRHF